jgi:hypothetical protein
MVSLYIFIVAGFRPAMHWDLLILAKSNGQAYGVLITGM